MLKTVEDLKKLEDLAKEITTHGPWQAVRYFVKTAYVRHAGDDEPMLQSEVAECDCERTAAFIAAANPQAVQELLATNEALAGMADSLARSQRRLPFDGFPEGYEEFAMKRHSAALNAHQLPEEQVETILAWALDQAGKETPHG